MTVLVGLSTPTTAGFASAQVTDTTVPPVDTTVPSVDTTVPVTDTTVPVTDTTVPDTETTTATTVPPSGSGTPVGSRKTKAKASSTTTSTEAATTTTEAPPTTVTVPPTTVTVPPTTVHKEVPVTTIVTTTLPVIDGNAAATPRRVPIGLLIAGAVVAVLVASGLAAARLRPRWVQWRMERAIQSQPVLQVARPSAPRRNLTLDHLWDEIPTANGAVRPRADVAASRADASMSLFGDNPAATHR